MVRNLDPVLALDSVHIVAVDVRQADVHDHEIDLSNLGRLNSCAAVFCRQGIELLMQRQLFLQRLAPESESSSTMRIFRMFDIVLNPAARAKAGSASVLLDIV